MEIIDKEITEKIEQVVELGEVSVLTLGRGGPWSEGHRIGRPTWGGL